MDKFECKAPMYVNFVQSSVLDESDGADTFFDVLSDGQNEQQTEGQFKVKEEPSENENDLLQIQNEQQVHDLHGGTDTERSTEVDDALNAAMTSLWLASGQRNSHARASTSKTKGPRLTNASIREYCNAKRKGSPLIESCHPRKFISLAEAVCHFQTSIPDRFHSRPKTDKRRSSLQQRKGIPVKHSTIPHSPNLRAHLRSRPVHYLTREEEEEKQAQEMKALQVKANALNPKIFEPPKLGVRVERKPPTVPVPFNLTEFVRKESEASPVFTFTANPVPKAIFDAPQGVPKKKELPLTVPVSPACLKKSKVYAMSLDVKDGEKCLTQKEIHGFGIPASAASDWKRTTEVQPFSFDERDQLFLKKKEENVKKYLELEKAARQFHANPVPAFVKSPNSVRQRPILPTDPAPFQLEVEKRGNLKQQQLKQKMNEEARKLQKAAQFKARPADVIHKQPFEPKKSERPLTDITAVELNTERRAKERHEFDAMLKAEHAKLEELRQLRDEKLKREEMEELARLRKESVHKANPVRHYKPINIMSSDKPLTDPCSPSFMSRPRANSK